MTAAPTKTVATQLVELAEEAYDLLVDTDGSPFAVAKSRRVALPLDGGRSSLRAALAALYFAEHGKAAGRNAVGEAVEVLRGRAQQQERVPIPLRHGRLPNSAVRVVDLGGPDEVHALVFARYEEGDETWAPAVASRVVFRRTALTAAMAEPRDGAGLADLERLRSVLNVRAEDWPLVVGWAVAVTLGDVPVPVLDLTGEAGAGKTSFARALVSLLDASSVPVRSAPRDVEQWIVTAAGSRVVALDNLSTVPDWLSDALCRAVTGDGLARRALYTDNEIAVTTFRRAVILTSIDTGAKRGDLAERLLTVELEPIPPERRLSEAELADHLAEILPDALGGLLHLAGCVLGALEHHGIRAEPRPRMADFADVLAAVDAVTGWTAMPAYLTVVSRAMADIVAGDQFTAAVAEIAGRDPAGWRGTAQELLAALHPLRPEASKRWPTTPRGVSGALRRAATALRSVGIDVEHERVGRDRTRIITMRARTVDQTEPPDRPRTVRVDGPGHRMFADGADGADGSLFSCDEEREEGEARSRTNRPHRPRGPQPSAVDVLAAAPWPTDADLDRLFAEEEPWT